MDVRNIVVGLVAEFDAAGSEEQKLKEQDFEAAIVEAFEDLACLSPFPISRLDETQTVKDGIGTLEFTKSQGEGRYGFFFRQPLNKHQRGKRLYSIDIDGQIARISDHDGTFNCVVYNQPLSIKNAVSSVVIDLMQYETFRKVARKVQLALV